MSSMPPVDVATPWVVHGLDLSYFTGKLEAYLRAKGIAHARAEMSTRSFRRAAAATGIAQMPQVELPDGRWLTDTTATIAWIEAALPRPAITPADPLTRFFSLLIEDFGDEALWRPALHYRWSYSPDARLMSRRIAEGMLRDAPAPLWVRRLAILARQRRIYLRQDGVRPATQAAVERLYLETLDALEAILATRAFVLGPRPSEADFGLFGSMFRHFGSDPTPLRLMQARAPLTLAWVGRVWALRAPLLDDMSAHVAPDDGFGPLFALIAQAHLPELQAHADAVAAGARRARFTMLGAAFDVPASRYKAHCLQSLSQSFKSLDGAARASAAARLGEAAGILEKSWPLIAPNHGALPLVARSDARTSNRHWLQ